MACTSGTLDVKKTTAHAGSVRYKGYKGLFAKEYGYRSKTLSSQ